LLEHRAHPVIAPRPAVHTSPIRTAPRVASPAVVHALQGPSRSGALSAADRNASTPRARTRAQGATTATAAAAGPAKSAAARARTSARSAAAPGTAAVAPGAAAAPESLVIPATTDQTRTATFFLPPPHTW
jgi:hypothetical protein